MFLQEVKNVLKLVHENFVQHVKNNRGDRLKKDDDFLFNGDFWVGEEAVKHGLVDGINDVESYAKQHFGENVNIRRINRQKQSSLSSLFPSRGFGHAT